MCGTSLRRPWVMAKRNLLTVKEADPYPQFLRPWYRTAQTYWATVTSKSCSSQFENMCVGLTGTTRKFREKMRRHLFDTAAAASTTMRSERDMSVVVVSVASPPNETFGTCGIINVSAYGVCGRRDGEDEPGQARTDTSKSGWYWIFFFCAATTVFPFRFFLLISEVSETSCIWRRSERILLWGSGQPRALCEDERPKDAGTFPRWWWRTAWRQRDSTFFFAFLSVFASHLEREVKRWTVMASQARLFR